MQEVLSGMIDHGDHYYRRDTIYQLSVCLGNVISLAKDLTVGAVWTDHIQVASSSGKSSAMRVPALPFQLLDIVGKNLKAPVTSCWQ